MDGPPAQNPRSHGESEGLQTQAHTEDRAGQSGEELKVDGVFFRASRSRRQYDEVLPPRNQGR